MSDPDRKQSNRLTERAVTLPKGAVAYDLMSVLVQCRVSCEYRRETRAADCVICPRLARFVRTDEGVGMRVQCYELDEEPRLARGTLEMMVRPLESLCSACNSDEGVLAHPEMVDVYFCRSCVDQMAEPIDWIELGTGD